LDVTGIKLAARVINTTEFRKFGTRFKDPELPSCSNLRFQSDEYWRCFIKETATINNHLTSSCRMGYGPKDKKAVLDSKLK
jgi:choline dehydrogenase-like flavoprotein